MANAIDQLTDRVLMLGRLTIVRRAITAVAVTISAVLQTFLIQAFIQPADLLPSGLTGVAVLLDRVTSLGGVHIDISLGMLALNIPVALLCWSGISKRFVIFSMMQVVLSSLFLNVFHFAPFLGDKIMLIIFGGVVSGLGAAIALKSGASTGGLDIPPLVLNKWFKLPVSATMLTFDIAVLLMQAVFSPVQQVLYGVVMVLIHTIVMDKMLMLGASRTEVKIVSSQSDAICAAILEQLDRGVTILHGEGGYTHESSAVLLSIVSNRELPRLEKLAHSIDPTCFLIVSHVTEVSGRGFSMDKDYL